MRTTISYLFGLFASLMHFHFRTFARCIPSQRIHQNCRSCIRAYRFYVSSNKQNFTRCEFHGLPTIENIILFSTFSVLLFPTCVCCDWPIRRRKRKRKKKKDQNEERLPPIYKPIWHFYMRTTSSALSKVKFYLFWQRIFAMHVVFHTQTSDSPLAKRSTELEIQKIATKS